VSQRAAKSVEAPDNDGVSVTGKLQQFVETRPVDDRPGDLVTENSVATDLVKSVGLKNKILFVSACALVPEVHFCSCMPLLINLRFKVLVDCGMQDWDTRLSSRPGPQTSFDKRAATGRL
jgi:hypothetical protein